jgi:hypothetical protein
MFVKAFLFDHIHLQIQGTLVDSDTGHLKEDSPVRR